MARWMQVPLKVDVAGASPESPCVGKVTNLTSLSELSNRALQVDNVIIFRGIFRVWYIGCDGAAVKSEEAMPMRSDGLIW